MQRGKQEVWALEPGTRIATLVDAEMARASSRGLDQRLLADFRAALVPSEPVDVQFSGGRMLTCWTVTRSDGDYRVVYLPEAGYFSLCVEGLFGPLDIGVHGNAIGCFASV